MAMRIVRLGSPRHPDEGLRIGTVRRPPRGVPRTDYARLDWFDVWFPTLAPSAEAMKLGQAAQTEADWDAFARRYRREMQAPEAAHALALLAAMSRLNALSVGCYCEDARRCHRSLLRDLLVAQGAQVLPGGPGEGD